MSRKWLAPAIALLAIAILAPPALAEGRDFDRDDVPSYGFRIYYGPSFYPNWWFGPSWRYDPWYSPWYGPAWGHHYRGRYNRTGNVKIETRQKGDKIYVDGGYAGVTGKLKKFPLKAGTHTLKLRNPSGHTVFSERITVIPGRTLKIHPDFTG